MSVSPTGDTALPGYRISATTRPEPLESRADQLLRHIRSETPLATSQDNHLDVYVTVFPGSRNAYVATEIHVSASEVTTVVLRTIPVTRIVRNGMDWLENEGWPGVPVVDVPDSAKVAWSRGRKDEAAPVVAKVYINALARNMPPAETIADKFEVSRSTAGRMVRYAREGGYLTI